MAANLLQLGEYQTRPLLPLAVRGPGTTTIQMSTKGNALLSSVFVAGGDPGATVKVRWYDTTTGRDDGERFDLAEHPELSTTSTNTSRVTVTRIHDRPVCEIEVVGGNVEFGIYVSVINSLATDLDAALQFDASSFEPGSDKAIPTAGLDDTNNVFRILRLDEQGRLLISGDIQVIQKLANFRASGMVADCAFGVSTSIIDYTIPAGKTFIWADGLGHSSTMCQYRVEIDGALWMVSGDDSMCSDVRLRVENSLQLTEGQNIKVSAITKHPAGIDAPVWAFLYGSLD